MYTAAERCDRVKTRVRRYRRRREWRIQGTLGSVCVLLLFSFVKAIWMLSGGVHSGETSGMQGSIMLKENAGGYVLVGVISFMAAVVITLLCIHFREKQKNRKG